MRKCFLETTVFGHCPQGCKNKFNYSGSAIEENCIADLKMEAFLRDQVTFRVGISAFYESNPRILEKFLWDSKDSQELISYFLYISEPQQVKNIIESFSNHTLSYLFKTDFFNFQNVKDSTKRDKSIKHMFDVRSYRYWKCIDVKRICSLIQYFVHELKEPEYACQFIVILPSEVAANLRSYTILTTDEEKSLYTALGDSIYELPIQSPKIYDHMLQLFADEMEIFLILSTMEELIRRQEMILDKSAKLIEYTKSHQIVMNIQFIFSELNGLDLGIASEILNQLLDSKMISISQRALVLDFIQTGNLDILKPLRNDLLGR